MTPTGIRELVVTERVAWVREMLAGLRELPLDDEAQFFADSRNLAAAESYLRRALEALLDLSRHVLAKGFGRAALEYNEIATSLGACDVLSNEEAALMREMAGYRNRLVHFYDHVGGQELYEIARERSPEVERILEAVLTWVQENPDHLDRS